jgi:hypothetical protein
MQILDYYVQSAPSNQNSLDIFKTEWASKLPAELEVTAGQSFLFEDPRITWVNEQFGGLQGQEILELGPLEAGHTYMMEQLGATSVTAIEANTRAYLKCLIAKEILNLKNAHFLLGDFIEYLKQHPRKFDLCIASGVLYHMQNPAELIDLISQVTDRVFLWTHYYDEALMPQKKEFIHRFPSASVVDYKGFSHTLYRQEYGEALGYASFCGGSHAFSTWMKREEIIACLSFFGFSNITTSFENPHNPGGPCFAIAATRS